MKKLIPAAILAMAIGLSACGDSKVNKSDLKTFKDSVSYSIGLDIGKNLKQQNIEITPSVLLQGIKDALKKDSLFYLSEKDQQTIMMRLNQELMQKQMDKMKGTSEKNKKEGEAFLAENAKKEGVKTTQSGLQYKVIKSGTGATPKLTDQVTCNYIGRLINGKEFDSSIKRGQPATFPVNGVIPGWTEALQLMKAGDKWELYIPSNLAYGDHGAGNVIEPGATLIFEIELLSVGK